MIEELIVVEGKNDAQAIRRALGDVDILWTEGYGLSEEKLCYIEEMAKRRGVIILTDPDSVGNQIRERIQKRVPAAKHIYLSKAVARKGQDIGVENVSPEDICRAFAHVQSEKSEVANFGIEDLLVAGLAGQKDSAEKRQLIGQRLGLGDTNAKQFLHRLNRFGISRTEFWRVVEEATNGKCS